MTTKMKADAIDAAKYFPDVLFETARRGLRRTEGLGRSSPTAAFCPTCRRATIRRPSGEWCRWCRGWVSELAIYQGTESVQRTLRVVGGYHP